MATLAVHVSPKAGKNQIVGVRAGEDAMQELEVRVTAVPEKGAANKALCKLIAKEIGVPQSALSVKRGESSRHKLLEIDIHEDALRDWLNCLEHLAK